MQSFNIKHGKNTVEATKPWPSNYRGKGSHKTQVVEGPEDITINVSYLNLRCLGDGTMRQIKMDLLIDELSKKPDVLLLTETRC